MILEFSPHYLINLIPFSPVRVFYFISSEFKNLLSSSHSQAMEYFDGKQRLTLSSSLG